MGKNRDLENDENEQVVEFVEEIMSVIYQLYDNTLKNLVNR
nr:hypothetical protein [uncultured Lysinibacillus sp.]